MSLRNLIKLKESLLFRLTILYSAAFTILGAMGFTVFYCRLYSVTIERMDVELVAEVHEYETLAAERGFQAIRKKILEDSQSEDPGEEFFRLMNSLGEVLVTTDLPAWGESDRRQALSGVKSSHSGYFAQTIRLPGDDHRARTMTARIGPSLFLQIGETLEETDEYLDIFHNLLLLLMATLILISTAIGWVLAKRDMAEVSLEDTDDWYAQDIDGNVWYFGEISKNYEAGELVDLDGSWKAGVEEAIPGISMPANSRAGDIYRQEFALGEAEDMAAVVNRGEEAVALPYGDFSEAMLKTGEYTPIDPEVFKFKYYAPTVGMVLEVNPETGERVELVDVTLP